MMKKSVLILAALAFSLGACKTTGTTPEMGEAKAVQVPALPPALSKRAERLPDITDPTMGGIQLDGVKTDRKYNELAFQTNALIAAYNCVREAVNARDASMIEKCLEEGVE